MKETIYTIPVNEAYESGADCPLCFLRDKLEREALDYGLGAAMMEPDYRVESNELGYCNRHFEMLCAMPNKLSLALVLQTHLAEIEKKLDAIEVAHGGGLFKKPKDPIKKAAEDVGRINDGCIICKKIDYTMERYIEVLLSMWDTEPDFRERFRASGGVCIKHMEGLIDAAAKYLSAAKAKEFTLELLDLEKKDLKRVEENLKKFILKFDYRNRDMDITGAEDAPQKTLEKIGGSVRDNFQ